MRSELEFIKHIKLSMTPRKEKYLNKVRVYDLFYLANHCR
jgi:hypothetical protein